MSKCWYCNNELTTGDNPKHFGICNKCYDEMFKSGDTIIRSLTDKIAELQKELEEKEKEIEDLRKIHSIKDDVSQCEVVNGVKFYTEQIMIVQILKYNYEMQINNLKQQLKSQPKEIVEKIRKWGQKHYNWVGDGTGYDGQNYNECIGFNMAIDQLNEILDAILNGVSYD